MQSSEPSRFSLSPGERRRDREMKFKIAFAVPFQVWSGGMPGTSVKQGMGLNWARCEHQEVSVSHQRNGDPWRAAEQAQTQNPSSALGPTEGELCCGEFIAMVQAGNVSCRLKSLPCTMPPTSRSFILGQEKTQDHWTQATAFNTSADFLHWITSF